jgi:hypothetical protein
MRTAQAVAMAAALVVALGASAAAQARPVAPGRCGFKGAEVLRAAGTARLVLRESGGDDLYGPESRIYVCVAGHQPKLLAAYEVGTIPTVSLVRFTARYVAFATSTVDTACTKYSGDDPACVSAAIASYDRRTGRVRARDDARPDALVLTAAGWPAWTVVDAAAGGHVLAAKVGAQHLALGAGAIDPASLRAVGNTLTWTLGGDAQSATL